MILWSVLLACSAEKSSDGDFYSDSVWYDTGSQDYDAAAEEEGTTDSAEYDMPVPKWWRLFADMETEAGALSEDASIIKAVVYDELVEPICIQKYAISQSVSIEPSFDEGLLWWDLQLIDADEVSTDDGTQEDTSDESNDSTTTQNCDFALSIPSTFQLGIGQFHIETQAVWESVEWLDLTMEQDPEAINSVYSSYVSFDGGENIWVYGVAISNLIGADDVLSEAELVSMDQVWYLRPAYVFPLE